MPAPARPRPAPPEAWRIWSRWLELPPAMDRQLWKAIATSRDPEVRSWYLTIAYYQPTGDRVTAQALLEGPLSPLRTVGMLEALAHSEACTRAEVNAIETAILAWTNRSGQWG